MECLITTAPKVDVIKSGYKLSPSLFVEVLALTAPRYVNRLLRWEQFLERILVFKSQNITQLRTVIR